MTQLPAEQHGAFCLLSDDSAWLPFAGPAGSGHPLEWTVDTEACAGQTATFLRLNPRPQAGL